MVQSIRVRAAVVLVAAVRAVLLAGCAKAQPVSAKSAPSKQSGPRQAPARPGLPASPASPEQLGPATGNSSFVRPAAGTTIAGYDGVRNKGIDIGGSRGDPVVAAASGRVMLVSNS